MCAQFHPNQCNPIVSTGKPTLKRRAQKNAKIEFTQMENAHNNCWCNSTLQCLTRCVPFIDFINGLQSDIVGALSRLQTRLVSTFKKLISKQPLITSHNMASVLNLCHRFVGLRFSAQCDPLEFIQRALVPLFRACGRNPLQLTLRNTYTCSTCNTPVGTSDCQTGINLHMDITARMDTFIQYLRV